MFRRGDELFVAHLSQTISKQLDPFRLPHSIQDAVKNASHHDTGDTNNAHGKSKRGQIGKDFIDAAILAKLLAVIEHFNTAEVRRPFVVKRAVHSSSVFHPEATSLKLDAMTAGHDEFSPGLRFAGGFPSLREAVSSVDFNALQFTATDKSGRTLFDPSASGVP